MLKAELIEENKRLRAELEKHKPKMKSIDEVRDWLIKYRTTEGGNLDLNGLDFSNFDGDVRIMYMTVKKGLNQSYHKVGDYLVQRGHEVKNWVSQDSLIVGGDLNQGNQTVKGALDQGHQKVNAYINQNHQTAGLDICQQYQTTKEYLRTGYNKAAKGELEYTDYGQFIDKPQLKEYLDLPLREIIEKLEVLDSPGGTLCPTCNKKVMSTIREMDETVSICHECFEKRDKK